MEPPARLVLSAPLCVLWRPDGRLQLGLDADRSFVLPDAPAGADAVLRALRSPRTPLELSRLVPSVPADRLAALLGVLREAGLLRPAESPPAPDVTVLGAGPLALAVAALLEAERVPVHRGTRDHDPGDGLVLLCGATAEPDRVATRELAASGLPHLIVRVEPERAVVGPFVAPGAGPCVGCTDLVRRDLDAAWPHLLAQLCRSEHVPAPRQTAWAAATAVAQVVAWRAGGVPEARGTTLELDAGGSFGVRRWPRHPDCGCALAAA